MSLAATAWAKRERVGKAGAKLVLMVLADYANDDWESWPRLDTLTFESEQGRRTVQRHLRFLEDQGLIQTKSRMSASSKRQTSNIYRLNPDAGEGRQNAPPAGPKEGPESPPNQGRQIDAPTPEADPKEGRQNDARGAVYRPPPGAVYRPPLELPEELPCEQLRASAAADGGFREWLGPEYLEVVRPWLEHYGVTDAQLSQLMIQIGPKGFARNVWLGTPTAEHPRLLAVAASDFLSEEVGRYGPFPFRGFIKGAAREFLKLQERTASAKEERVERDRRAAVRTSSGPQAVGDLVGERRDPKTEAMEFQIDEELRWADDLEPDDAARFQLWVNDLVEAHPYGHLDITRRTVLLESIRKARKHGLLEAIRGDAA